LDRYRLVKIAPGFMHQLFQSQSPFGKLSLKVHALIDRYFIEGKRFWLGTERQESRHSVANVDVTESILAQAHITQTPASTSSI
jgi:hypothetical protein